MVRKYFHLAHHKTTVQGEVRAGITIFLTLSYILFLQPSILSGQFANHPTGMDFGALLTATCLASAIATFIMALYVKLPIAQAPGMGENFFFTNSLLPAGAAIAAANDWQVALGAVFFTGLLFFLLVITGIAHRVIHAFSESMRDALVGGIGLFITLIGFENAGVIVKEAGLQLNPNLVSSPQTLVFFFGIVLGAILQVRKVKSFILWSIVGSFLMTIALHFIFPVKLDFSFPEAVVSLPPSIAPLFWKLDFVHAFSLKMLPLILVLLVLSLFDATGSLMAVAQEAGYMRKGEHLAKARPALLANSLSAMIGAIFGMSTVISYTESLAGVEQGGRTGLTSFTVACLFLLALFLYPVIQMIASYPYITASALVLVGAVMIKRIKEIEWMDYTEMLPSILVIFCIPFFFSIADGVGIGLVAYPLIKLATGKWKQVNVLSVSLGLFFLLYFLFLY